LRPFWQIPYSRDDLGGLMHDGNQKGPPSSPYLRDAKHFFTEPRAAGLAAAPLNPNSRGYHVGLLYISENMQKLGS
jgi:hypothetical protein